MWKVVERLRQKAGSGAIWPFSQPFEERAMRGEGGAEFSTILIAVSLSGSM
jgi:hypothetical protein